MQRISGNLPSPKTGHTTGGSCPGARRGGGAGTGRAGCQQKCAPLGQSFHALSTASLTGRLKAPHKARTSENLCSPMAEQNLHFKTDLAQVYQQDKKAFFSWLLTIELSPFNVKNVREAAQSKTRTYPGQVSFFLTADLQNKVLLSLSTLQCRPCPGKRFL